MRNINFQGAILVEAALRSTDLTGANLMGANLEEAVLVRAILINANLENANMMGAFFTQANLIGANNPPMPEEAERRVWQLIVVRGLINYAKKHSILACLPIILSFLDFSSARPSFS